MLRWHRIATVMEPSLIAAVLLTRGRNTDVISCTRPGGRMVDIVMRTRSAAGRGTRGHSPPADIR